MSLRNFSSVAVATTLSAGINASTTTVNVAAVSGWPSAPFLIRVDENTASEEVMLVTAVVGTTLTVTRGYDSTVGVSHSSGATVAHCVSAIDFREANSHVNASSGVHGLTGSVVGTTDTQTLTNKTLSSPAISDFTSAGHTHLSTAQGGLLTGYVRSDGSSTLTLGTSTTTFTVQAAASQSTPILTVQDSAAAALVQIGSTGTFSTLKSHVASAGSAATVPLVAKGAASQTANLTEWQSSASAVLASVDKNGLGTFAGLASTAASTLGKTTAVSPTSTTQAIIAKAAAALQTTNILEVQDNTGTARFGIRDNSFGFYLAQSDIFLANYGIQSNAGTASFIPVIANGVSGQTANLQEWRTNSVNVATMDPAGNLSVAGMTLNGTAVKRVARGVASLTFTSGNATLTYGSLGFTPTAVVLTPVLSGTAIIVTLGGAPGATTVAVKAFDTAGAGFTGSLGQCHWVAVE